MSFSITKFVPELLTQNPEKRFTAREIALWIMASYPAACEEKRQRSRARKVPLDTDEALLQQIVAEIGAQRKGILKKNKNIRATEGRPRKYYFSEASELRDLEAPIEDAVVAREGQIATNYEATVEQESDLYPRLAQYLTTELSIYPKRIDERRSKNQRGRGANKWLYPDLVGMEDLSREWEQEVRDCAREYSDKKTKLWSFEVKMRLNRSNVRESYFQTVSNSSWANFGYLVCAEIEGDDTLPELRVLAGLHGIGVIRLDIEDISESQIVIPAREKADVDWGTINRLVQENSDFVQYVRLVRQFYQTGDPRKNDWDALIEPL